MRRLLAALGLVVLATAGLAACGSDTGSLEGVTRTPPLDVSSVTLPDRTNGTDTPFTFKAKPGELLLVYFGYTSCPDICPTTMQDLRTARDHLSKEQSSKLDLAFVTVDRERDTPTQLSGFLSHFADRYHAIVPESDEQLKSAQDKFLASSTVTKKPDGTVEVAHSAYAYAVDDQGKVLVEWSFGTSWKSMANDLRTLLSSPAATSS